jgi:membrane associated rhomboid family serine protease
MFEGSPITTIILIVTGLVSWQAFNNSSLYEKMLFNPYSVKHRKQYYRILSHTLVHADIMHLALNMLVFYSFGRIMEVYLAVKYGPSAGTLLFILLYVVGAATAAIPAMRKHADNYGYNAVGASGAVSAVMMSYMILFPLAEIAFFFIPMKAFIGVIVFFLFEHFMNRSGKTNIAHDAHIWGALFGILFIFLLEPQSLVHFFAQVREYLF